jgi:hypothetical protein
MRLPDSSRLPVITLGRFTKIWFSSHPGPYTTTKQPQSRVIGEVRVDILLIYCGRFFNPCGYPISTLFLLSIYPVQINTFHYPLLGPH